ncbi:hypothetical protein D3C87_1886510 [compost metagenome]
MASVVFFETVTLFFTKIASILPDDFDTIFSGGILVVITISVFTTSGYFINQETKKSIKMMANIKTVPHRIIQCGTLVRMS